jgi:hypothetical protein
MWGALAKNDRRFRTGRCEHRSEPAKLFYYDRPLGVKEDPDLGPALRSWGNLRISSVPQQINTDVATFATGLAQQAGQLKVNEVAQAFEFLGAETERWCGKPSTIGHTSVTDHASATDHTYGTATTSLTT